MMNSNHLLLLPWTSCTINERTYYFKYDIQNAGYNLLITDLKNIHSENIQDENLMTRFKELNPWVEISTDGILKQIEIIILSMKTAPSPCISEVDDTGTDNIIIKSNTTITGTGPIGGCNFRWNFILKPESSEMFWQHVTQPIVCMMAELTKQKEKLIKMIQEKDVEIEDYKAGGAVVSRKYLQTKPFSEKTFSTECLADKDSAKDESIKMAMNKQTELYMHVAVCLDKRNHVSEIKPAPHKVEKIRSESLSDAKTNIDKLDEDIEVEKKRELERIETSKKKKKKKIKL